MSDQHGSERRGNFLRGRAIKILSDSGFEFNEIMKLTFNEKHFVGMVFDAMVSDELLGSHPYFDDEETVHNIKANVLENYQETGDVNQIRDEVRKMIGEEMERLDLMPKCRM